MKNLDNFDAIILASRPARLEDCTPEIRAEYEEAAKTLGGLPPIYPGSIFVPCEECGVDVVLGPRQQEVRDSDRATTVLCMRDAALMTAQESALGNMPALEHLGNPFTNKKEGPA